MFMEILMLPFKILLIRPMAGGREGREGKNFKFLSNAKHSVIL